jgi:hypothetical protein
LGERIDRPSDPNTPDEVLPGFQSRPGVRGAILPFTGGNVFALGILALALVATGGVLILSSSRKRQSQV